MTSPSAFVCPIRWSPTSGRLSPPHPVDRGHSEAAPLRSDRRSASLRRHRRCRCCYWQTMEGLSAQTRIIIQTAEQAISPHFVSDIKLRVVISKPLESWSVISGHGKVCLWKSGGLPESAKWPILSLKGLFAKTTLKKYQDYLKVFSPMTHTQACN